MPQVYLHDISDLVLQERWAAWDEVKSGERIRELRSV